MKVRCWFECHAQWYNGVVTRTYTSSDEPTLYHVKYDDGDSEDVDAEELKTIRRNYMQHKRSSTDDGVQASHPVTNSPSPKKKKCGHRRSKNRKNKEPANKRKAILPLDPEMMFVKESQVPVQCNVPPPPPSPTLTFSLHLSLT
jgi:hypothetical protein